MKATLERHSLRLTPETPDEERWMEECLGLPSAEDSLVQGGRDIRATSTRYHDQVYAMIWSMPHEPNYRRW